MPRSVSLKARFKEIFRSAFFDLPRVKKRLLQGALGLFGIGAAGTGYALATDGGQPGQGWSWATLSAGAGCILGFFVGAALRVFVKLALMLGAVVAAGLFGLSWLGWIELPWSSFGEVNSAVADYVYRASDSLQQFASSYLPPSVTGALGLASGVTQKPDMDPND